MTTFYVTGLKFKSSYGHCSAIPNKVWAWHNTIQYTIRPIKWVKTLKYNNTAHIALMGMA